MRSPMRAACAVLVAVFALSACAGGEPFQPTHTGVVPLAEDDGAGQTFRSGSGSVHGVDVLVATYGQAADPAGTLTVDLVGSPGGAPLATARARGAALSDNAWVELVFDGAVDVGDGAAIEARWDGASPVALRANVPPAGQDAGRLLNDPYPGGELLRDGRRATGDLAFRVAGSGGPASVAGDAVRFARGAGVHLLDRPLFAAAWLLLLAGAVALALRAR